MKNKLRTNIKEDMHMDTHRKLKKKKKEKVVTNRTSDLFDKKCKGINK